MTWHWAKYITAWLTDASAYSSDWVLAWDRNPQPGSSQCVQHSFSDTTLDDWGSFLTPRSQWAPPLFPLSYNSQALGHKSSVTFSYHCFMEDTTLLSLCLLFLCHDFKKTDTTCLGRLCTQSCFISCHQQQSTKRKLEVGRTRRLLSATLPPNLLPLAFFILPRVILKWIRKLTKWLGSTQNMVWSVPPLPGSHSSPAATPMLPIRSILLQSTSGALADKARLTKINSKAEQGLWKVNLPRLGLRIDNARHGRKNWLWYDCDNSLKDRMEG